VHEVLGIQRLQRVRLERVTGSCVARGGRAATVLALDRLDRGDAEDRAQLTLIEDAGVRLGCSVVGERSVTLYSVDPPTIARTASVNPAISRSWSCSRRSPIVAFTARKTWNGSGPSTNAPMIWSPSSTAHSSIGLDCWPRPNASATMPAASEIMSRSMLMSVAVTEHSCARGFGCGAAAAGAQRLTDQRPLCAGSRNCQVGAPGSGPPASGPACALGEITAIAPLFRMICREVNES
jgi:hypothetical protein